MTLAGLLWMFCALLLQQSQRPAAVEGGATVHVLVVDKRSGQPIPRAMVTLTPRDSSQRRPALHRTASLEGDVTFDGLDAGKYGVSAVPGEFRGTYARAGSGVKEIEVKPGEMKSRVAIELIPTAAISGRVVDAAGLPLSGVQIRVLPIDASGRGTVGAMRTTDDLGAFRAFGLVPGIYKVCGDAPRSHEIRPVPDNRRQRFVDTCYPSAVDEPPGRVVVEETDVDGIDIVMRQSPTFTIRGTVVDSTGTPTPPTSIGLVRVEQFGSSSTSTTGLQYQGGTFAISGLVAGSYAVHAEIGKVGSAEREQALVPVDISSADVEGLIVATKKGARVRGAIRFEDGPPSSVAPERMRVTLRRTDRRWSLGERIEPGVPTPQLTFELTGLFGPFVVELQGLPPAHAVKAIRYKGTDILDVSTEFDGDPAKTIDIIVTGRVAELSGRVTDDRGSPAAGAQVFIFPADSARWGNRERTTAFADKEGTFKRGGLVAGEYLVAAVSLQDAAVLGGMDWYGRGPLERLAKIAERVTLVENDRRTMDVRMMPLPQESR